MNTKNMQQLKEFTISGFKSISSRNPLKIELGNINVLLGANGSGKSNIISFFKMLNAMMFGSFQLFVEKAGTSQVFLNYGSKYTSDIGGELFFEDKFSMSRYVFKLSYATPDRLIISSEDLEWGDKRDPMRTSFLPDFKESGFIRDPDQDLKEFQGLLRNCRVYQFYDSSVESPIRQSSHIDFSDYLQVEGNNLASFLYSLKTNYPVNYSRIVSYIRQIMPQFNDFYLEPNKKGYVMLKWMDISPNDYVLLPEQFSDGTIRFIALATLLLQPKETMPNVIIIDEPELGLHPFAIAQLAQMIKEASMSTQVIIATQSPGLVDEFEANQVIIIERDEENESTVANKLSEQELSDWLANYSVSELWNKNVIGGRP